MLDRGSDGDHFVLGGNSHGDRERPKADSRIGPKVFASISPKVFPYNVAIYVIALLLI